MPRQVQYCMPCHAMPCHVHVCRKQPLRRATQCMEPYRYIVGNHAPAQMQGRFLGPRETGVRLPIAAVGSLTLEMQKPIRACLARNSTAKAGRTRDTLCGVTKSRPQDTAAVTHADKAERNKDAANWFLLVLFSFPCMRKKLHATMRWGG
jgi:hypothetical protein